MQLEDLEPRSEAKPDNTEQHLSPSQKTLARAKSSEFIPPPEQNGQTLKQAVLIVSDEKPGAKKSLADAFKKGGLARKLGQSQKRKKTQTKKEKTKEELAALRKEMMKKRPTVKDDEMRAEDKLEYNF
jgi:hypothetical protein